MTIRVMIVDDSAVMRRLLTMALRPATDIEVVGMAANGREALELLDAVHPDLVTLDVEMPEMDGLATMQAIHAARPELAVIMCSGLTEQHAVTTINALRAGAVDHITKPMASSSDEALQTVHDQLVPKIRVLANRSLQRPRRVVVAAPVDDAVAVVDDVHARAASDELAADHGVDDGESHEPTASTAAPVDAHDATAAAPATTARRAPAERRAPRKTKTPTPRAARRSPRTTTPEDAPAAVPVLAGPSTPVELRPWPSPLPLIDIVAIGVSTGGPVVLERVLESLPERFPVPIVIVQHMPAVFTKILAERIDGKTALKVREAAGGEVLAPGTVWLAPGGLHLKVRRTGADAVLALDNGAPENSCKPAVDVLFRSVASTFGGRSLAAVFTGMGRDGTVGTQAIVDAGGVCIAQDEATSTVWGMPGSVAQRGLANALVPLEDLAPAIESVVARTPWTGLVGQTA